MCEVWNRDGEVLGSSCRGEQDITNGQVVEKRSWIMPLRNVEQRGCLPWLLLVICESANSSVWKSRCSRCTVDPEFIISKVTIRMV